MVLDREADEPWAPVASPEGFVFGDWKSDPLGEGAASQAVTG